MELYRLWAILVRLSGTIAPYLTKMAFKSSALTVAQVAMTDPPRSLRGYVSASQSVWHAFRS